VLTSIISPFFIFYAKCPSCHNPPTLSWFGTGTKYAGLHTKWRGYVLPFPITEKLFINFENNSNVKIVFVDN